MAAYNASSFINESIHSILSQTFADFELIIVDDASTDNTADILARHSDSRIVVLRAERNLGPVGARNLGFAIARGDFLAVHDADDISHPTRFTAQMAYMNSHPSCVMVSSNIRQLHPCGTLITPRYQGAASPQTLRWMLHLGNPVAFSSTMMRMDALKRLPEFLRQARCYAEDMDLYVRLGALGDFARLNAPLLTYRVHAFGISARKTTSMVHQTHAILQDLWRATPYLALAADGTDQRAMQDVAATILSDRMCQPNFAQLHQLRLVLEALEAAFLRQNPECTPLDVAAIKSYTRSLWGDVMFRSLLAGHVLWPWQRALTWDGLNPAIEQGSRLSTYLCNALKTRIKTLFRKRQQNTAPV